MWLSSKLAREVRQETAADLGVTTVSGQTAGVQTRGEVRSLPVYGPAGLAWVPRNGDTVLVIKGGTGGEESCVAGAEQKAAPGDLQPGELCLYTAGAAIRLYNDGRVCIDGALFINGEPYAPCTC